MGSANFARVSGIPSELLQIIKCRLPRMAAVFTVLAVTAASASYGQQGMLSGSDVAEDPRLGAKITLASSRMTVGELCERLSSEMHVSISANTSDGSSDVPIYVNVRELKLESLLNGLWSLVSFKGAPWRWEKTLQSGVFTYRLRKSTAAEQLPAKLMQMSTSAL